MYSMFKGYLSSRCNERQHLIRSGNVFLYEEHASGIKRWTDGLSWSPSRVLGDFLIYREIMAEVPRGKKKRLKSNNTRNKAVKGQLVSHQRSRCGTVSGPVSCDANLNADVMRPLIGSLTDTYAFKTDGLIKKTISISHEGRHYHLVSYYNISDVLDGRLMTPTEQPNLAGIIPRPALLKQDVLEPVEDIQSTNPYHFISEIDGSWQVWSRIPRSPPPLYAVEFHSYQMPAMSEMQAAQMYAARLNSADAFRPITTF